MDISDQLNQMDCTYYFIIDDDDVTKCLKEDVQESICKELRQYTQAGYYGMRSGPDVRDGLELKNEFKETIPEQIEVVYVNEKTEKIILLSTPQRDEFFKTVMSLEENTDTLTIVQRVLKEIQ